MYFSTLGVLKNGGVESGCGIYSVNLGLLSNTFPPTFKFLPLCLYPKLLIPCGELLFPDHKRDPSKNSVSGNDTNQDPNPRALETSVITVLIQDASSSNLTLGRKFGLIHTVAARAA